MPRIVAIILLVVALALLMIWRNGAAENSEAAFRISVTSRDAFILNSNGETLAVVPGFYDEMEYEISQLSEVQIVDDETGETVLNEGYSYKVAIRDYPIYFSEKSGIFAVRRLQTSELYTPNQAFTDTLIIYDTRARRVGEFIDLNLMPPEQLKAWASDTPMTFWQDGYLVSVNSSGQLLIWKYGDDIIYTDTSGDVLSDVNRFSSNGMYFVYRRGRTSSENHVGDKYIVVRLYDGATAKYSAPNPIERDSRQRSDRWYGEHQLSDDGTLSVSVVTNPEIADSPEFWKSESMTEEEAAKWQDPYRYERIELPFKEGDHRL